MAKGWRAQGQSYSDVGIRDRLANGYDFGDVLGGLWQDITGQTKTAQQNTAAAKLQDDAQLFNMSEADKQRQFELDMSNTAHQREVADLKAAGLNPWLSTGNGATMNSAASASSGIGVAAVNNTNPLAAVGTAAAGIGILIKALKAVL